MKKLLSWFAVATAALAQQATPIPSSATAVVPAGTALRIAIEKRVAIKRVDQPIEGRLIDPIYSYDRMLIRAGSVVEGHIAEIGGVSAYRRFAALLSGNLTPARSVRAQFDTLVMSDGSRVPLNTSLSQGTAHTQRVAVRGRQNEPRAETSQAAVRAFTPPGRLNRLKSRLFGMLPYHRQAWSAGTLFNTALERPLTGLTPIPIEAGSTPGSAGQLKALEVQARLLTPINSAKAHIGAPVEAAVAQPLFSAELGLLIPEGSRLLGNVVEVQPARLLHRNGKVLFVFRQIQLPQGNPQSIQGYLDAVEADFDAHLNLDTEGTAHVSSPKSRFIFPAIAVAVAGLSFHQDYNSGGVPDQDAGGRAESGAVGLGLIGTALAQTSRAVASSFAISGAALSLYSNFIARGRNVVLPENTALTVSLRKRENEAASGNAADAK